MRTALILLATTALAASCGGAAVGIGVAHGSRISSTGPAATASATGTPPPLPSGREFAREVNNPWFPLKPGSVLTYRGESDGIPATDVFRITRRHKKILGIEATIVDDRVYTRGRLSERTTDYYAQDLTGNVWYLGEDTATLKPNGKIESRSGTFRAGVKGARAGIFMPANPAVGAGGFQEYFPGHAQDQFVVLSLHTRVKTPAASSSEAMTTQETTALEPGVLDHKIYVRGFGTVREETIKGGNERYRLVSARIP
jgi:hypothetical protein